MIRRFTASLLLLSATIASAETNTAGPRLEGSSFSEVAVIDAGGSLSDESSSPDVQTYSIEGGKYHFVLDVSQTPDLASWAHEQLVPAVQEWYPKLVAMLPSHGFTAPKSFSITFSKEMQGVASTTGTSITGAESWYRKNLENGAAGSIVHEMIHVVQQYGDGPQPGWLVEGVADYIRFYCYEPQTHGADIQPRNIATARYDNSYRVTANFLNWVTNQNHPNLVRDLNTAMRQGRYNEKLWQKLTGHSLQQLGDEWKQSLVQGTR